MSATVKPLKNWHYKQSTIPEWSPSKNADQQVVEIFPDLIANGVIADPFYERNEKDVQWVGQADWEYKSEFTIGDLSKKHLLRFNGLDTFATVYLNDEQILNTESQFRVFTYQIINPVKENVLRVYLKSPLYHGRPELLTFTNADVSRLHVRKAQYHYGWDWGPILVTCSPGKIDLIEYEPACIKDIYVNYKVTDVASGSVEFTVEETLYGDDDDLKDVQLTHELVDTDGGSVWKSGSESKLTGAKLWYPFQYGEPNLYTLKSTLAYIGGGGRSVIDTKTVSLGFRKVEVIQDPLPKGATFYFKINDIAIYMNGSNWIPGHSFLTEFKDSDYEDWLALLRNSNQNMLRIWGGGIYETDKLYDIANKEGILVWQDFLFACGQYPNGEEFKANVDAEAKDNIIRLRNNPSLVIFAGNNEDYQIRDEFKLNEETFYAKEIYEDILPSNVSKYSNLPYIKGTPFSPGDELNSGDLTVGDVHQWNVWHGSETPYQQWDQLVGRFVSEFGMAAYPSYKTLAKYISCDQLHPQSLPIETHNKADLAIKKIPYYVFDNLKITKFDLPHWIYLTQLCQADCHSFALQAFRRLWNQSRECSGQLVWQINDCYPVTSWALVDCEKRPKLGYFAYKRFSQDVVIGFKREEIYKGEERGKDYKILQPKEYDLKVWISNLKLSVVKAKVQIDLYEISTNKLIETYISETDFAANITTEHQTISLPSINSTDIVTQLRLFDAEGNLIHENASWPQPLKYVQFTNDRKVEYEVKDGEIKVWSNAVVKAVDLQFEDDFILEDNGFDLFPGAEKVLKVQGLKAGDKLQVRFYDQPFELN